MSLTDREAVTSMVAGSSSLGVGSMSCANAGGGRGRPMDTKASALDRPSYRWSRRDESVWDPYSCNAVVWCGNQLATAVAETVILRKINHSFLQTYCHCV
jgi:hypothetical protein